MTAHTFETILFFIASTAIICTVAAIGAMINRFLINRRPKADAMLQRTMDSPLPYRNK